MEHDSEVLARLDERTKRMEHDIADLKGGYVSMDRFRPVEMLVYGQTAFMLIAILEAMIYVVLPHR